MFTLSTAVAKPLSTLTLLDHATMRAPVGPIEKDEKFILVYHDAVHSLYVHLEPEGHFVLHFKDDMTKATVETKIGAVFSVLPHFFDLKDAADQPWIPTRDPAQHVWVNLTVPRGGVRTVSSTVEFDPTQHDEPQEPQAQHQEQHPPDQQHGPEEAPQDQDEEPQQQWRQHQQEAAYETPAYRWISSSRSRSRTRGRSPSISPTTSLRTRPATSMTHAFWSDADPRQVHFPPAQEEPASVPVMEEDVVVGFVWAQPRALAGEVVQDFADEMYIECLVDFNPVQAVYWRDLESLGLAGRPVIASDTYLDFSQSRWELFQTVREIPVILGGLIEDMVVISMHLSLHQVQMRLDYRAPYPEIWNVVGLDHLNWVITTRQLPGNLQYAIAGIDRIRTRRLSRGGKRASSHTCMQNGQARAVLQDTDVTCVQHVVDEQKNNVDYGIDIGTDEDIKKHAKPKDYVFVERDELLLYGFLDDDHYDMSSLDHYVTEEGVGTGMMCVTKVRILVKVHTEQMANLDVLPPLFGQEKYATMCDAYEHNLIENSSPFGLVGGYRAGGRSSKQYAP